MTFDTIVVTSPDELSAQAARRGPLHSIIKDLSTNLKDGIKDETTPMAPQDHQDGNDHERDPSMTSSSSIHRTHVLSTCDPFQTKVGSGGGTLAAIDYADVHYHSIHSDSRISTDDANNIGKNADTNTSRNAKKEHKLTCEQNVLIIHAGGQSSRCPSQIPLGKAWTSLPVADQNFQPTSISLDKTTCPTHESINNDSTSRNTTTIIDNPTNLLIQSLESLFHDLPKGSIVVAASDVLLSLGDSTTFQHSSFLTEAYKSHPNSVVGLAVPAPLDTATNHGVFVLPQNDHTDIKKKEHAMKDDTSQYPSNEPCIQPIHQFYQKPSVQKMRETPFCTFMHSKHNDPQEDADSELMTWIDTGVVIFFPESASRLRSLLNGTLDVCVERGLKRLYDAYCHHSNNGVIIESRDDDKDLKAFAQEQAPKVELYTHIMLALSTDGGKNRSLETATSINPSSAPSSDKSKDTVTKRRREYLSNSSNADLDSKILESIFDSLYDLELRVLCIPQGQFIHLGTTRELRDFLIYGVNDEGNESNCSLESLDKDLSSGDQTNNIRIRSSCQDFGKRIHLVRRSQTFLSGIDAHSTSVVMNSVIDMSSSSEQGLHSSNIGKLSVVEHCHVKLPSSSKGALEIGPNSLVSGIRGTVKDGSKIKILQNTVFQIIPLQSGWSKKVFGYEYSTEGESTKVLKHTETSSPEFTKTVVPSEHKVNNDCLYIYLGVDDAIKKHDTWFGVNIDTILKSIELKSCDIWDDGVKPTLWNAKLHPVLPRNQFVNILDWEPFLWIEALVHHTRSLDDDSDGISNSTPMMQEDTIKESLKRWKALPKLALSHIRLLADADAEFHLRHDLQSNILPQTVLSKFNGIQKSLVGRHHRHVCYDFVLDELVNLKQPQYSPYFQRMLSCLKDSVQLALSEGHFDVCGRAFMLISGLLFDVATEVEKNESITSNAMYHDVEADKLTQESVTKKQFQAELEQVVSYSFTTEERLQVCENIFHQFFIGLSMSPGTSSLFQFYATEMERLASTFNQICISSLTNQVTVTQHINQWVVAEAPARIDLSGGWSDTFPICYEHGGSVSCLAVSVNKRKPLSAKCRLVSLRNKSIRRDRIRLCTESRDIDSGDLVESTVVGVNTINDLADFSEPLAKCSILKCALICLGFIPMSALKDKKLSLEPYIDSFCKLNGQTNIGLEIISTSYLPRGSGMGSSSILGGCILSAISECVGVSLADRFLNSGKDASDGDSTLPLIQAVLYLEQLLSTGGGWQDQVGGLVGGLKLCKSDAHILPLQIHVQQVPLSSEIQRKLDERIVLVNTGHCRLAKNILQCVLRKWAKRSPSILKTVSDLVDGAHFSIAAIQRQDLNSLGKQIASYWSQKMIMAGEESGVEPNEVKDFLEILYQEDVIEGGTLCGAGGGGFLALILCEGKTKDHVRSCIQCDSFTIHDCNVSMEGIRVEWQ